MVSIGIKSFLWKTSLYFLATPRRHCRAFSPLSARSLSTQQSSKIPDQRHNHTNLRLPRLFATAKTTEMTKSKASSSSSTNDANDSVVVGIMMILSPAKTLDVTPLAVDDKNDDYIPNSSLWTVPSCNMDKTRQVVQAMKKRSQSELAKLLSISSNLASKSHEVTY